jgi:hypothetical protein
MNCQTQAVSNAIDQSAAEACALLAAEAEVAAEKAEETRKRRVVTPP